MIRRVYSSVGHGGRWGLERFIGPPATAFGRREDLLALRMATAFTLAWAGDHGREWALRGVGTYGARQREASGDLYLDWHTNSGVGDRAHALVAHNGVGAVLRAVEAIAGALLEFVDDVVARQVPTDYSPNAANLVGEVNGPGVLIEPGFLDAVEHAHLWEADGPEQLGRRIASHLAEVP